MRCTPTGGAGRGARKNEYGERDDDGAPEPEPEDRESGEREPPPLPALPGVVPGVVGLLGLAGVVHVHELADPGVVVEPGVSGRTSEHGAPGVIGSSTLFGVAPRSSGRATADDVAMTSSSFTVTRCSESSRDTTAERFALVTTPA